MHPRSSVRTGLEDQIHVTVSLTEPSNPHCVEHRSMNVRLEAAKDEINVPIALSAFRDKRGLKATKPLCFLYYKKQSVTG